MTGTNCGTVQNLGDFLCTILALVNTALPVLVGLAVLVFFWGLVLYIFSIGGEGDDKKQKQGRNLMIWGIIAFFVMLSLFGIIRIAQTTFNFQNPNAQIPNVPRIPQQGQGGGFQFQNQSGGIPGQ